MSEETVEWGNGLFLRITAYLADDVPPPEYVTSVRAIVRRGGSGGARRRRHIPYSARGRMRRGRNSCGDPSSRSVGRDRLGNRRTVPGRRIAFPSSGATTGPLRLSLSRLDAIGLLGGSRRVQTRREQARKVRSRIAALSRESADFPKCRARRTQKECGSNVRTCACRNSDQTHARNGH